MTIQRPLGRNECDADHAVDVSGPEQTGKLKNEMARPTISMQRLRNGSGNHAAAISMTTQAHIGKPTSEIPNGLNLVIMAAQLLALAACIGAVARIGGGWPLALLAVLFGIVMNSVYSIIHEAEHGMLFSNRL